MKDDFFPDDFVDMALEELSFVGPRSCWYCPWPLSRSRIAVSGDTVGRAGSDPQRSVETRT